MAYMTRSWLRGAPQRHRFHLPTRVWVKSLLSDWPERPHIYAQIEATNKEGDYQIIYFDKTDLNKVLPLLIEGADLHIRKDIALEIFQNLNDKDVAEFLAKAMKYRAGRNT